MHLMDENLWRLPWRSMKLMRISRTKRRISASSMRAVDRRRSRKLLGRADIMLLHWKPVDTCKGARHGCASECWPSQQPAEVGSEAAIVSGISQSRFPSPDPPRARALEA